MNSNKSDNGDSPRKYQQIKSEKSPINRISEYGGKINQNIDQEPLNIDSYNPSLEKSDKQSESFLTESIINLNQNVIKNPYVEDPRLSVDFSNFPNSPLNKSQSGENFINRTQYDPNLYNKKFEIFSNNDMSSRSVYNPNISTMRFMAEIDLRCDDHLTKYKEDVLAARYCSDCKILCCDSCVIEFHSQHIQAAKVKLEDYFKKQKLELEELKSKITSSIKNKSALTELNDTMENHEKTLSNYFNKRKNLLENLKSKIETIMSEESDLYNRLKDNLENFYHDECFRRMDKPLKENESLLINLQNFLKDWDGFSRTDKAKALKNDQVNYFKQEAQDLNESIQKAVDTFKSKSKILENNLGDILKNFGYNDKLNQIDTIILEISEKIKNSMNQVNKLHFDELGPDEGNLQNLNQDQNQKVSMPSQEGSVSCSNNKLKNPSINLNEKIKNYSEDFSYKENEYSIIPNKEKCVISTVNSVNQGFDFRDFCNLQNNSNFNTVPIPIQNISHAPAIPLNDTTQKIATNFHLTKHNYDLLIGIKPKSDELIIFDPRHNSFLPIKLNKTFFEDQSRSFTFFPENSKYVNLGFSIMLSGGYINRQVTNNCFLIVVTRKENSLLSSQYNQTIYDVSIIPYANMLEQRERHNMVYLFDRNMILACSGFFSSSAEITDINSGIWKELPKMNDVRANATIAYINKRYVWVCGGFKINEKQVGIYQNTCEVLDLNNLHAGWSLYDFDKMNINFKLSAMGVINYDENSVLLCGGYDGTTYKKEVYKIKTDGVRIAEMNNQMKCLPGNYIFLHSNFVKIDNFDYNYDLNMNIIIFNPNEETFDVKNYLNLNQKK